MLPAPLLLLSFLLCQLSFLVLVAVAETSGWRDIGDDGAQVPHHPLTPTAVGVSRLRTVHVGGVEGKTGGIEPRTFTVQPPVQPRQQGVVPSPRMHQGFLSFRV